MVVKLYDMDDVGTRAEHMSDLQELWSGALCILTTGTYHNPDEIRQAEEVEIALKLLENHMCHAYDQTGYARVINDLPYDARNIKDNKEKP